MPPRELADRKRTLVNELNSYIALKKNYASADEARGELLAGAGPGGGGGGETVTGGGKVDAYDGERRAHPSAWRRESEPAAAGP